MKTTLTHASPSAQTPWPNLLAQQLDHWQGLTPITTAEVILEHQRHDRLAFHVTVRLELAGPGLRGEVRGATLEGALLLATRDLEQQIQARRTKPLGLETGTRPSSGPPKP